MSRLLRSERVWYISWASARLRRIAPKGSAANKSTAWGFRIALFSFCSVQASATVISYTNPIYEHCASRQAGEGSAVQMIQ
ncbi:hypothetical protein FKX85_01565 [Echinicola soli]|uniref:Uncharacterized protein n=1 Tax=Echinicola soli TaxID=2591634 RepID=A0A514CDA9_9BACT|nr:hypothetical protein [Echinicola soli]QDH77802.1 hypothetical protein FKX85_01565 [Echinicola soli]